MINMNSIYHGRSIASARFLEDKTLAVEKRFRHYRESSPEFDEPWRRITTEEIGRSVRIHF